MLLELNNQLSLYKFIIEYKKKRMKESYKWLKKSNIYNNLKNINNNVNVNIFDSIPNIFLITDKKVNSITKVKHLNRIFEIIKYMDVYIYPLSLYKFIIEYN